MAAGVEPSAGCACGWLAVDLRPDKHRAPPGCVSPDDLPVLLRRQLQEQTTAAALKRGIESLTCSQVHGCGRPQNHLSHTVGRGQCAGASERPVGGWRRELNDPPVPLKEAEVHAIRPSSRKGAGLGGTTAAKPFAGAIAGWISRTPGQRIQADPQMARIWPRSRSLVLMPVRRPWAGLQREPKANILWKHIMSTLLDCEHLDEPPQVFWSQSRRPLMIAAAAQLLAPASSICSAKRTRYLQPAAFSMFRMA